MFREPVNAPAIELIPFANQSSPLMMVAKAPSIILASLFISELATSSAAHLGTFGLLPTTPFKSPFKKSNINGHNFSNKQKIMFMIFFAASERGRAIGDGVTKPSNLNNFPINLKMLSRIALITNLTRDAIDLDTLLTIFRTSTIVFLIGSMNPKAVCSRLLIVPIKDCNFSVI